MTLVWILYVQIDTNRLLTSPLPSLATEPSTYVDPDDFHEGGPLIFKIVDLPTQQLDLSVDLDQLLFRSVDYFHHTQHSRDTLRR